MWKITSAFTYETLIFHTIFSVEIFKEINILFLVLKRKKKQFFKFFFKFNYLQRIDYEKEFLKKRTKDRILEIMDELNFLKYKNASNMKKQYKCYERTTMNLKS
jgi:hypothetical protein